MKRMILCRAPVCCLLRRPWRRRVDHGSSALLQKLPATLYPMWKRLDDHLESFWLSSSKVYAFSLNLKINHIILSLDEITKMCCFNLKTIYTNIIYSINFSQESVKWTGKHEIKNTALYYFPLFFNFALVLLSVLLFSTNQYRDLLHILTIFHATELSQ